MTIEDELHNAAPAKLTVDRVTQAYRWKRQHATALDVATLPVAQGELGCLAGPGGAGKSSPMNVTAGAGRPHVSSYSTVVG